jgi:multiple sugar transport system permease protein
MLQKELVSTPVSISRAQRPWANIFDRTFHYWAVLPLLAVLVGLTLYPALQLIRMSVSDVKFVEGQLVWNFTGLDTVQQMLKNDPVVSVAIGNTLVYVLAAVTLETLFGMILALAVSRVRRFSAFYRAVFVIPILIPPVAISTMWRLIYDYNYGILNQLLAAVGIPGPTWTANPDLAMISVIIVDLWHWTSFLFLILLAGVESLPHELTEAARVDMARPNCGSIGM